MSIPPVIFALVDPITGKVKDTSRNKREIICKCIGFNDFIGHKWGLNDVGIVVEYGANGVKPIQINPEIVDKFSE